MKQWVVKLIEQFESDRGAKASVIRANLGDEEIGEDRATLLYIIDIYNKNLIEFDKQPVRKVREILDEFTKALLNKTSNIDKVLFRFRQFFTAYRMEEYTYIQNTFNEFKHIIWDFADQLSDDIRFEKTQDDVVKVSLDELREAVEANSIDELKVKSREFIDHYVEQQTRRDERRTKSLTLIQTNLDHVKKKLASATHKAQVDHLTQAHNRMSFDAHVGAVIERVHAKGRPAALIYFDLDHFKKVNDTFGHDGGDEVLRQCVKLMKALFSRPTDFVARLGGEEFAIVLENSSAEEAILRAEEALQKVRETAVVHGSFQIRYTISMGIAELSKKETAAEWVKRADSALYQSKSSGRDRYTLAPPGHLRVASGE